MPAISNPLAPSQETTRWLHSVAGQQALMVRCGKARLALREARFNGRLRHEMAGNGVSNPAWVAGALRNLSSHLAMLAMAHEMGCRFEEDAWDDAREAGTLLLSAGILSHHFLAATPPLKTDLLTADTGVMVAAAASFDSPLGWNREEVDRFLNHHVVDPIREEWVEDVTRAHSLDSMGHNWWSVIVGGLGVVLAISGRQAEARGIAGLLQQWFAYSGNEFGRKTCNFGVDGDFVEGFAYGEYALMSPFSLSFALKDPSLISTWLDDRQCQGLAAWFKRAFLPLKGGGWWPQRFGDVHLRYRSSVEVWHTLFRLTGDEELLALAQALKPVPGELFEFLIWQPLSAGSPGGKKQPVGEAPAIHPVSGIAFLGGERVRLTVRAGEFWNHNHQDAGSFIFHQDGVVWVDDSGTCRYSEEKYVAHYCHAKAHNVAYAPALSPPDTRLAAHQGVHVPGRFIFHSKASGLEALAVDTQVLTGGRLARSGRFFLVLDDSATLIWDDLEAYEPTSFDFLLHTAHGAASRNGEPTMLEGPEGACCPLAVFSDPPVRFSEAPAEMGELLEHDVPYTKESQPSFHLGTRLRWHSEAGLRQKFGLVMGTRLEGASWKSTDTGWETTFRLLDARWSIWFNRAADGRTMHKSPICSWRGIETDAYALALREEAGKTTIFGIQASFIRTGGAVLAASAQRQELLVAEAPAAH